MSRSDRIVRLAMHLIVAALAAGCSSYRRPTAVIDDQPYREHAQTKGDERIEVTTAVLEPDETERILGVRLEEKWMQALWIEVTNKDDRPYWLLLPSLDPDYYSADEVAYAFQSTLGESGYRSLAEHLREVSYKNPIPRGETRSGLVFVNRDDSAKEIDVQMLSINRLEEFTFYHELSGLRAKTFQTAAEVYAESEREEVYEDELRFALRNLPCCTTDAEGEGEGDPLNLVLIGEVGDLFPAFVRRGWQPAEETYWGSVWKTINSFLFGERYRYSPVSPLYVFGRVQDVALQKARGTVHQRNHLRLWLTPLHYEGKPIWIGQISRDIGVRFTLRSGIGVTHKIDPDVDETRNALVQDMLFSQGLVRLGFVKGVMPSTPGDPERNLTGDPYFTDGLRAVLVMDGRPTPMGELEFFDWEIPSGRGLYLAESGAR